MSKSATTNNTTKRYDGEGTINQRKDGRWEYRVSLGKVNGKYAYKSFYAPTERELKKLIKQYNSDLLESDRNSHPKASRINQSESDRNSQS